MQIDLRFVDHVADLPAFQDLLREFYTAVTPGLIAAGGPRLDAPDMAAQTIANLSDLLPPRNRLILGWDDTGRLMACATLRRIRPDAVEMKRLFVRPEARGTGTGQRLFDMRIKAAKAMGCRAIYADTYKGNQAMLAIYEKFGFRRIARYPENANPPDMAPALVFLEYRFD